jgi:hypothetical protein
MSDSKKAYKNWKVQQGSDIIFPNQVWQAACDWKASAQDGVSSSADCILVPRSLIERWANVDAFNVPRGAAMELKVAAQMMLSTQQQPSTVVPDDSKHHAVMQAQMWAQEARTQKAIVMEIGKLVGCKNDWEMVEAVKAALASTVVQESAACVSPEPHYETQRGLSCKSSTQSAVVPEGYSLVPSTMVLDYESFELIKMTTGDGETEDDFSECTLWVGELVDDDGKPDAYGLNIACSECMEEGSITVVEFPRPTKSTIPKLN